MTKQEYINRVLLIMNEAGLYDKEGNSFIGADSAQVDRYIEGSFVDTWRRCAQVFPKAWFKNERFDIYPKVENLSDGTGYIILPSDFYLLNSFKLDRWRKPVFEAYMENDRTSSIQSNEYTRGSEIRPVATISNKIFEFTPNIITDFQEDTPSKMLSSDLIWYNPQNFSLFKPSAGLGGWEYIEYNVYKKGDIFKFGNTFYILTNNPAQDQWHELKEIKVNPGITQVLNYFSLQKGLPSHTIEEAIYIPVAKSLSEYSNEDELGLDHRIIEPMAYLSASSVFTIFEKYDIAKALELRVVEMFPAFKSVKGTNVTFKQ
jgi:hypothetical protein